MHQRFLSHNLYTFPKFRSKLSFLGSNRYFSGVYWLSWGQSWEKWRVFQKDGHHTRHTVWKDVCQNVLSKYPRFFCSSNFYSKMKQTQQFHHCSLGNVHILMETSPQTIFLPTRNRYQRARESGQMSSLAKCGLRISVRLAAFNIPRENSKDWGVKSSYWTCSFLKFFDIFSIYYMLYARKTKVIVTCSVHEVLKI